MPLHRQPSRANARVQTHAAEEVVLKLKTPWRDGTICCRPWSSCSGWPRWCPGRGTPLGSLPLIVCPLEEAGRRRPRAPPSRGDGIPHRSCAPPSIV
jgi:hypothetical protein